MTNTSFRPLKAGLVLNSINVEPNDTKNPLGFRPLKAGLVLNKNF